MPGVVNWIQRPLLIFLLGQNYIYLWTILFSSVQDLPSNVHFYRIHLGRMYVELDLLVSLKSASNYQLRMPSE